MKDIKDILQELDLDLSNPDVVQAATEAIMQILAGRQGEIPETLKDRLSKKAQRPDDSDDGSEPIDLGEIEQEIDPNLIQPPQRQSGSNDVETEIEDEENVLNRIRQLGDKNNTKNDNGGNGGSEGESESPDNPSTTKPKDTTDDTPGEEPGDTPGDTPGDMPGDTPGEKPGEGTEGSTNGGNSGAGGGEPGDEPGGESGDGHGNGSGGGNGPLEEPGEETSHGDTGSDGRGGSTGDGETDDTEDADITDGGGAGGADADGEDGTEGEDADSDFTSKLAGKNPKNEAQRIQVERTLKAAQKAQKKAEENGQNAIATLLEKCQELLEDILDELESDPSSEVSEQKIGKVIQKTLDAISEVDKAGLTFKSDEERAEQVKKIKDIMSDTASTAELSAEDVEQIRADKQAIINNQREIDKYATRSKRSFKGFEEFITSLRKSLAMQISTEKTKANSWAAINRRHDGTSVVKPGIKNRTLPSHKIPVIDFYFDCSASWDDYDLQKGDEAVSKIAQLERDGEIKINMFYFANNVYADPNSPRNEGGTGAWNHIIDNIILTRATNVVIMTDNDMEWQCEDPPHKGYKVTGFVWYLWKDGSNAQKLPNLLQGRSGTMQYSFDG